MPIVEEVSARSQQSLGAFKRKSDPARYRTHWAVVEGNTDGRYPSVQELTGTGLPIGRDGRARLRFEEFSEGGKPNDIHVGGLKLRECVVPIEEAIEKESREARISTEDCRDFLSQEDLASRESADGLLRMKATLETNSVLRDDKAEPLPAGERIVTGWTPERKAAAAERMAKARAAKAAKQLQAQT